MEEPESWSILTYEQPLKLSTIQAIPLPKSQPPSRVEKRQIARYRTLRAQIHEGPLYTILGDHARDAKSVRVSKAAALDPFQGTPTLSDKFRKQHRHIPKLDARPYIMRFFPRELWTTLDPKYNETAADGADAKRAGKRKVLKIGKSRGDILEELAKAEQRFKLENPGDDDDEDKDELEEEEEKIEEEQDTDYEGQEDEADDDDYNAQGYWEAEEYGDEDMGDDYGGGDDGGGYMD